MTPFERSLTTTVNDIEPHRGRFICGLWSRQDLLPTDRRHPHGQRAGHLRIPDSAQADAPGITPPLVLNYSASTVPNHPARPFGKGNVGADALGSGTNMIRTQLVTVPGAYVADCPCWRQDARKSIDLILARGEVAHVYSNCDLACSAGQDRSVPGGERNGLPRQPRADRTADPDRSGLRASCRRRAVATRRREP